MPIIILQVCWLKSYTNFSWLFGGLVLLALIPSSNYRVIYTPIHTYIHCFRCQAYRSCLSRQASKAEFFSWLSLNLIRRPCPEKSLLCQLIAYMKDEEKAEGRTTTCSFARKVSAYNYLVQYF